MTQNISTDYSSDLDTFFDDPIQSTRLVKPPSGSSLISWANRLELESTTLKELVNELITELKLMRSNSEKSFLESSRMITSSEAKHTKELVKLSTSLSSIIASQKQISKYIKESSARDLVSLNKVESFSRTVESLCMKSEADTKMLNIQLKKLVSQDDLNAKSLEDIKNFLTILLRLLDQPQKTDPDEVVPNSPPIQTPLTEIIISSQATPSKISTSSLPASAESDYYYSPISKKKRKL